MPQLEEPDLFKLITAQARVRLSLENRWLGEYADYIEKEGERKKAQEKKWEEEKRERLKRRRELEKAKLKAAKTAVRSV